jgi:hypothetical protein
MRKSSLQNKPSERTRYRAPLKGAVRLENEMKNTASIIGLTLPSVLCVSLVISLKRDLETNASGEAAGFLIFGGLFSVLLLFALSCIPNVICLLLAVRKKEPLWKLSALGIPLCALLTVGAVIIM